MTWAGFQGGGLEPGLGSRRWAGKWLEPGLGSKAVGWNLGWIPGSRLEPRLGSKRVGLNLGWVPRGWAGARARFQGLGSQELEPGLGSGEDWLD